MKAFYFVMLLGLFSTISLQAQQREYVLLVHGGAGNIASVEKMMRSLVCIMQH